MRKDLQRGSMGAKPAGQGVRAEGGPGSCGATLHP